MPHNPKDNSRKKGVADERRRQRQEEAEARKRERDKRTPEEQMQRLLARGIRGGREYDRLAAQIDSGRGKLVNGQAPADKIVPEDESTHPKTRNQRKQERKGGKK